ncbi:hypothetical protein LB572_20155 [Mesorhizobium sp. BH1-1-5]|uniref:hypothetical protein n=1 Tax=Mesorhizobium sp. BH1-1-5 TaxID=2876661 RepID=UPI001CCCA49E|nr:hypothetical protein [Mesorhizobium sp. BH1-1-5]MBZ9989414.1 hypothetical protein [Mesorhizobium sp. BH1-1-5]
MKDRRVLAGFLLATTFLNTPQALAQEKREVLAPIEVQGEAVGDRTPGFDGYKAKKDASATKSDQPLERRRRRSASSAAGRSTTRRRARWSRRRALRRASVRKPSATTPATTGS